MKWRWLTLPNLISGTRLPLAFVFGWAVWDEAHLGSWLWLGVALAAAVAAMVSDFLDGYVARKLGMGSDVGKLLDPVADAFFFVLAFLALARGGVIPWFLAAPFLVRELIQHLYVRPVALRRGVVIAAKYIGKVKTACQCVTVILVVLIESLRLLLGEGWHSRSDVQNGLNWVNWIAVGVTAALSLYSLVPYLRTLWALGEIERSVLTPKLPPGKPESLPPSPTAQNDASRL